jgi:hypothetical protein
MQGKKKEITVQLTVFYSVKKLGSDSDDSEKGKPKKV